MTTIRSSLANLIPSKASPEELEAIKRDGWREHRILVISLDDPRFNWVQKQTILSLGREIYGDFSKKGTIQNDR